MTTIESRLQRLADLEDLRRLKFTYARLVDKMPGEHTQEDEDALANVFTENAVADFGARLGRIEGRAALRKLFTQSLPASRNWFMHFVTNPLLDVHGDRATGQWMVLAYTQSRDTKIQSVVLGRYQDEYVRTRAGWQVIRQTFVDETRT